MALITEVWRSFWYAVLTYLAAASLTVIALWLLGVDLMGPHADLIAFSCLTAFIGGVAWYWRR